VLQFRRPFVDAYINNAGALGFGAFFENPDGAESRRRPARFGESQRSIERALSSIEPVAAAGRRAGIASWWIMRRGCERLRHCGLFIMLGRSVTSKHQT
jgi:hypothetical protein